MNRMYSMLAFLACAMICLTSCDENDDKFSYMPTYQGFLISPSKPVAGQSITFTAVQEKKGHLLYHADYEWEVTYTTTDVEGAEKVYTEKKTSAVVYDLENADPTFTYKIPAGAGGSLVCKFTAEFRYSGQAAVVGADGSNYGDAGPANGGIYIKKSSGRDGQCQGTTRRIFVDPSK